MCRYKQETLNQIWEKGQSVPGFDKNKYRKDACGAWIDRDEYGNRESPFGWEVDHIYPEAKLKQKNVDAKLIDNPINLRPLNWHNNDSKGTDYPSYQAKMKSDGSKNIEGTFEFTVNEETRNKVEQLYRDYL